MKVKLYATVDPGLEHVVLEELAEIAPLERAVVAPGRLYFTAPLELLPKIITWSRTVNKLYLVLSEEEASNLEDIYRAVKNTPIEQYLEPNQSFAVRASRLGEHSFTSIDIARVAGQAVIDRFLSLGLPRPPVNLDNPDVEIACELRYSHLIVSLNLTRESLHKRGYRIYNHVAALKTTIAAAMLRLARFRPEHVLLDPMCGGGTIVTEAGLIRKNIPPVLYGRYLELRLRKITSLRSLWEAIAEEVDRAKERVLGKISSEKKSICMDISPKHLEGAILNARSAGVDDTVRFVVGDAKRIDQYVGDVPDVVVTNPPYGHRMHRHRLDELYYHFLTSLSKLGRGIVAVFITSAVDVAERVLENTDVELLKRIYVLHGTLPSYIYVVRT